MGKIEKESGSLLKSTLTKLSTALVDRANLHFQLGDQDRGIDDCDRNDEIQSRLRKLVC